MEVGVVFAVLIGIIWVISKFSSAANVPSVPPPQARVDKLEAQRTTNRRLLDHYIPSEHVDTLEIATATGNAVYLDLLGSALKELIEKDPSPDAWYTRSSLGFRFSSNVTRRVLWYVWGDPYSFIWHYFEEDDGQNGTVWLLGPFGSHGTIRVTQCDGITLVRLSDNQPPESFLSRIKAFPLQDFHDAFSTILEIPCFTEFGKCDSWMFPNKLTEFFEHARECGLVTTLRKIPDSYSPPVTTESHKRKSLWLHSPGTLVEIADGVAIDSQGRIQTSIGDGLVLRNDGSYGVQISDDLMIDNDGGLTTRLTDGLFAHSDGRLTTDVFGFSVTLGQHKPRQKGFMDL